MSVITYDEVDAFFTHHGVKGMHWGVRRDLDKSPKSSKELTKAAAKNLKKAGKPITDQRINEIFNVDTNVDSSKLSTRDRKIAAGKEFYRLTKTKNKALYDVAYVSTNKTDRDRYRAVLSDVTSPRFAKRSYSPTYEMTLKNVTALSLPSPKARFDAFVNLMDTPSIQVGKKTLTGREYLKKQGLGRDVKKLDSIRLGEKYYQNFSQDQFANTPINSAYFKSLRDKGYNAISDDNDRNIVSDDPIIVIDTKSSLTTIATKRLSNDEINQAKAEFTAPKKLLEKQKKKGGD